MPRPPEWTQQEIRVMRKYYQTHGWRKVHEMTGRSRWAIHNKAQKMGLCGRAGKAKRQYNAKHSDETIREIRTNRRGWTQARWAEEIGTTQGVISKIQNGINYSYVE